MTKRSTVKKNKKNYNSYHKTSEAYDYSYAVPKPKEDKKPKIKKKKKRGTPKLKIKYVYSNKNNGKISMSTYGTIFVFFICAVFWVFSYSMVNIQRAVNENLRKELNENYSIVESLKIDLDQKNNLEEIGRIAREKLHMSEPEPNQIVHIKVPKSNYTEVLTESTKKTNHLDKLKNFLLNKLFKD